jgi:hypothetical protein
VGIPTRAFAIDMGEEMNYSVFFEYLLVVSANPLDLWVNSYLFQ